MSHRPKRPAALVLWLAIACMPITANATVISHTDTFGIKWTLSSDGVNHGTTAAPVYDIYILADTTGFSTTSHGVTYSYANGNAYINDIAVLANASPVSGVTLGPGDFTDTSLWTNVVGSEGSKGCTGSGAKWDCAYSTAGGNEPTTGPGVMMSSTQTHPGNLGGAGHFEWKFSETFAAGTKPTQALSFASNGSAIKADYYGKDTSGSYNFIGQISDDVTLNHTIPEPKTVALFLLGFAGLLVCHRRRPGGNTCRRSAGA